MSNLGINQNVLLLIDWENVFFSLYNHFGPTSASINDRFDSLMNWVKNELGELLGGFGYIFAPGRLTSYYEMCEKNNLQIMICPKKKGRKGVRKEKDTVDEKIIAFGRTMLEIPGLDIVCLVSGDEDFVPLLEMARAKGIKVALVVPTLNSLSTDKVIIKLIDSHPITGRKMVLRLDQVLELA